MVIILFKFSLSASQVSQLTIKDGPFLNSIDWYIESTTSYVNSLTFERKIESLNQLGVVTIRFSNFSDSIEEKKSSGPDSGIEFIHHPRFEFEIFIEAEYHIMNYPPSYYFKHKGVLVVIYTGLERLIQFRYLDQMISFPQYYH